ncbi:MAG: hypothetical protein ACKVKP_09735 [Acidimicrobiales bacterium]
MTIINPPAHPLNILVTKTLTLPEVSETDRQMIRTAAGPGASVTVVDGPKEALPTLMLFSALPPNGYSRRR